MKKKIIFDLVHGYIEIDPDMERLINCESFQRLKFINQLTAQHLYPSSNHTRFEHSLGVMNLSLLFFDRIKDKLQTIIDGKQQELFPNIDFLIDHLKYAALLHDVGHAPLSHIGEHFYNKDEIIEKIKTEHLKYSLNVDIDYFNNKGSNHEIMSCYIIIKNFKRIFDEILVNIDYDFIYRIIVGVRYNNKKYPERNVIISIVNSDAFDVDKLDYLLRDNYMTGKVGPEIDIPRLLMSLTINRDYEIAFIHSALSSLQKVIDCRDNIYMWVCNHHTVVYTDYLYKECFEHFNNLYKMSVSPNKQHEEALPFSDLFSCEAISESCVDDSDALHFIKNAMRSVKRGKSNSTYTKNIVTQLKDRNYLKPTWKTLYKYNQYVKTIQDQFDIKRQKEIIKYVAENGNNRKKIVHYLCDQLGIELGNLFIVDRKNKFYCEKMDEIYLLIGDKEVSLSVMLPPRDYKKIYDVVAFYIFCEEGRREDVKNKFLEFFVGNMDKD
jgi:HD superfamily phosphohydrolase